MEIVAYPSEPLADKIESILRRRIGVTDEVEEAVRQVLHQVRTRGDQAVVEYTERFDGVSVGKVVTACRLLCYKRDWTA